MDWRKATEQDRMKLYDVLKDILWHADMDWSDLMSRAHGRPIVVEPHLAGNFRRGRISRRTAQRLSNWLQREWPEEYRHMVSKIKHHEPAAQ
jgi:hypothetical protein